MIKKSEVVKRQRETHDAEAKRLEEGIDKALAMGHGLPLRYEVKGFSKTAIDAVKEKYEREGGYSVRMDYGDQRDPCYDLVLS